MKLVNSDRGRLDRAGRQTGIDEALEAGLHRDRVRRRHAGEGDRRGLIGNRRHADAKRADHAARTTEGRQCLGDPPARRGLAVRAGDRDHIEAFARRAHEAARQRAGAALQFGQRGDRVSRVEAERVGAVGFDQARVCAGGERLRHELAAVDRVARPGDERIAGGDAPAVGDERARAAGREPAERSVDRSELNHGPPTALTIRSSRPRPARRA